MAKSTVHVIRGRLDWAKVLGDPVLNTFSGEREWSVDITPNQAGLQLLKELGITDKLKTPKDGDERKQKFVTAKLKEYREDRKTGERVKNRPCTIVDAQGMPWEDGLLGNGTIADVKVAVSPRGTGKPRGIYINAIRVLKHVPYEGGGFEPLSEDDEFYGEEFDDNVDVEPKKADKGRKAAPVDDEDDLDDDVPF